MWLPKKPLAIAALEMSTESPLGGLMKHITSMLTGLSLAVLSFVASAHAQAGQRMTANIPFEFSVGGVDGITLPAGQYELRRYEANVFVVRNVGGRSLLAVSSGSIEGSGLPAKSRMKFATVHGRHVLVQVWNEPAGIGNEFPNTQTSVE
jgi:hypothetical protein